MNWVRLACELCAHTHACLIDRELCAQAAAAVFLFDFDFGVQLKLILIDIDIDIYIDDGT